MPRPVRSLTPWVVAVPVLLAGCSDTGNQTASHPSANPAAPATDTPPQAPASPKAEARAKLVTPNPGVNAQQLVDVVKSETIKGGEQTGGPSPSSVFWMKPDPAKIQDEPMTIEAPLGLNALTPVLVVPAYNPMTKGKFELGKRLYFDPRVSKDGTVSCATCHNPEKGWTDQLAHSIGIKGQEGQRNAPTVLNTAYGRTMFWDGRAPSLEGQAQGPIQNKIEMGDQTYEDIVTRLQAIPGYQEQFGKVFGTPVTLDGMAKAIATFERSALSGNSPFDRYNSENDVKALSESQKRGMILFGLRLNPEDNYKTDAVLKKANCTSCHIGFNFSDEKFHNLGVGWVASTGKYADLGRWAISPIGAKDDAEVGAFKTPTVRDVERTAPYMHDGSEKTLEAVIDFYDRGGNANPALDRDMKPLNLTAQEKADLVAFMRALTGEPVKVALPTLPPGPDGKSPDPAAALKTPAAPKTARETFHPNPVR